MVWFRNERTPAVLIAFRYNFAPGTFVSNDSVKINFDLEFFVSEIERFQFFGALENALFLESYKITFKNILPSVLKASKNRRKKFIPQKRTNLFDL